MRTPDFDEDGWELRDSEETSRAFPGSFAIPSVEARRGLQLGDFAKLVFEVSVDDPEHPVGVERMWVVVREIAGDRYFGLLDNEPDIDENDEFWLGSEIPFGPEHVIEIQKGDAASKAHAARTPLRSWPRA